MILFFTLGGYGLIGKTVTLQVINLGSIPSISMYYNKAREAQLAEQNTEAILVVSSSLTSGNMLIKYYYNG
jgi:hypothetical protein